MDAGHNQDNNSVIEGSTFLSIPVNTLNRMQRRKYLAATVSGVALAGCSSDSNDGDSGGDGGGNEVSAEWNHKQYNKVRFPSQSEGVFFESDDETQYIGVQLKITNDMSSSANLIYVGTAPEVTLSADGGTDDVTIHNKSEYSSLESVGAGETADATLLYTTPPEASNYSLVTREDSEHTYEINRNEDLEIELVDLSDS